MVRVLLDCDGVFLNFTALYLRIVEKQLGLYFTEDDVQDWDIGDGLGLTKVQKDRVHAELDSPHMGLQIQPIAGAVEGVKSLMAMPGVEIYFVTAPIKTNPTWVNDRIQVIGQLFGSEYEDHVISTKKKAPVFGHIFVDDKPQNVAEWSKAWPTCNALLWDIPGNRNAQGNFLRVADWPSVKRLVQIVGGAPSINLPNALKAAV